MTKKESLQKQATELDIEFDEKATIAQLEALISEQEAKTLDKPEDHVQEEKEEVKAEPKGAKAVVTDERGNVVRVYSKEKHGADFAKLAQSFVSHPKRQGYTVE